MQLTCDNASALVPSYLDDELTEAQAAPLRRHLLECPGCRDVAMDLKALKRWFVASEAPAVPSGFAQRVARRAFAGDPGVLVPHTAAVEEAEVSPAGGEVLPFVLRLTTVAAAALFVFAIGIRMQTLPDASEGLRADGLDVWEEIYDLQEAPPTAGVRPTVSKDAPDETAADDETTDPASTPETDPDGR